MTSNQPSPADLARPKALRVKIAMRYHLLLHRLKVTSGQNMASVIEDALELYFERKPALGGSPPEPPLEQPRDEAPRPSPRPSLMPRR